MNNNAIKYGLVGALVGGAIVWFSTTSAINFNNNGMMSMMGINPSSQSMRPQVSNSIDAHFIEQMIPHHEDAITMAKLAQTKAQRPEVKKLADSIIDSQGQEITLMQDWYKNWFGKDVPDNDQSINQHGAMGSNNNTGMRMMGDTTDMANLENAVDFDKAFLEEMIPHHQMAVMMANMLKGGTSRPEMKKLADDIVKAQTTEIDQMRNWLNN